MKQDEKHYCLSRISELQKYISKSTDNICSLKELDFKKLIKLLLGKMLEIIQLLGELEDDEKVHTAKKLYAAMSKLDYSTDSCLKLKKALETFSASLPVSENSINTKLLGRLMNRVKMGYFPTDPTHVSLIREKVSFPKNTQVNVLDPCCGCGLALSEFVKDSNAVSYGIELDEYRGGEAQAQLDRVGFGSFFHAKISHSVFHCIFLNPPYLSVISKDGVGVRHEKSFLAGSLPHLMYDGLLIYIIPYYRVTEDICKVLSDNFTDISVYRFSEPEFSKFKQVVIFARRKKRDEDKIQAKKLLYSCLLPEHIPLLSTDDDKKYTLPDISKKVDIFKGAVFNIYELSKQLKYSRSTDILFDSSKLENSQKHPPLPLGLGQIGLLGSTGAINGLIECETPHIVKGLIVKQHKSVVNHESEENDEVRVISSNRMIFNILTPDGEYKSLI